MWDYSRALVGNHQCHSVNSYERRSAMDVLIGLLVVLCIARHFTNRKIDNMRVKKWWDEGGKKDN